MTSLEIPTLLRLTYCIADQLFGRGVNARGWRMPWAVLESWQRCDSSFLPQIAGQGLEIMGLQRGGSEGSAFR